MADLQRRLERHLAEWLGAWPPKGELTIVGSPKRVTPAWDGRIYPVAGVETPEGTVLSVPPDAVEKTRAAGDDLATIGPALPAIVGRPDARFGRGVFRWSHELLDDQDPDAVWIPPDDERVPGWLSVFNGDVLVHLDEHGGYGAGVGRKRHDAFGSELSVATEEHLQGRGIARRLVAQAARRVADEGAVATYLHHPNNTASAHVAEASGFPDTGWWILGVPVAS